MQPHTKENLEATLVERRSTENADFVTKIETFLLTQETQYLYVRDEADFNQLVQLLGHDLFDYASIRSFSYESMGGELLSEVNPVADFEGTGSIHQIFNRLGDIGMNLEFCNDFQVHVIIDLDAETSVFYQYQSFEDSRVCTDCAGLEEYDPIDGSSRFYSCDHESSEFNSRYYAVLRNSIPPEEVEKALFFGAL